MTELAEEQIHPVGLFDKTAQRRIVQKKHDSIILDFSVELARAGY